MPSRNSSSRRRRPTGPRHTEPDVDRRVRQLDQQGDPLSLPEEIVVEANRIGRPVGIPTADADATTVNVAQLQQSSMADLMAMASEMDIATQPGVSKQDLIFEILKSKMRVNGLMYGEGTLEILPDGFGFLRSPQYHYLSCPDDIYVSPSQIRRFGLQTGSHVAGQIRPPKENERYFALLRIEAINRRDPVSVRSNVPFDALTPLHPRRRLVLQRIPSTDPENSGDGSANGSATTEAAEDVMDQVAASGESLNDPMINRVIDLVSPIGFGQRGLIVSPPRAGKTILLQNMARAVLANYPQAYVFMLLVDERPEEVTDMQREIAGSHCEVISSTFDEPAERHIQVADMVIEKAKRMVESGTDVVIFLDSITRLARAHNSDGETTGKLLSGGLDAGAMRGPKSLFGSARMVEEGGSLTILATALVDTGSRLDDVIYEEFKGTGNLEIKLDPTLVERRIWPAVDPFQTGTRREEMLLDPEEHRRVSAWRRSIVGLTPADAMADLTAALSKTANNAEFLMGISTEPTR